MDVIQFPFRVDVIGAGVADLRERLVVTVA